VRTRLRALNLADPAPATLIHADIGRAGPWGAPVRRKPTPARVRRWRIYPHAPWESFARARPPHLILIDGRFRAACALLAGKFLQRRRGEILFDDYVARPHYHCVERHLNVIQVAGRMARLTPKRSWNPEAVDADIERLYADWR
jgi:hypothetical protein